MPTRPRPTGYKKLRKVKFARAASAKTTHGIGSLRNLSKDSQATLEGQNTILRVAIT